MKDFLGRELNVGDEVVYLSHCRTSSALHRAVVTGFTPKKVNITRYRADGTCSWGEQKFPHHLVKVNWSEVVK